MELPELVVADADAWRAWLVEHHSQSTGVWLVLAKKGTSHPTMLSYEQALDEAICFGWVDGQLGRRESTTFRRRFTPRTVKSSWSKRNVAIADSLVASGRMHESGAVEIAKARDNGRWDAAYAGQATIEVPDDLLTALDAVPRAKAMFAILTSQNRYAVLYRINDAEKSDTRAKRVERYVDMLARGETIYPQARMLSD